MKSTLITVITFFILSSLSAQPSYFIKTYGGANEDYFTDVEMTPDGGYIMVGASKSYGPDPNSFDGYIVITDSLGNKLKGLGYNGGGEEEAMFIRRAPDSTYYVCFFSDNGINNYKSHLLHLNDTLGWMWESYVFSSVNNKFFDGCFLPNGEFVITAKINDSISSAIWFDNNGDTLFSRTLANDDSTFFTKIDYHSNTITVTGYKTGADIIMYQMDESGLMKDTIFYPSTYYSLKSIYNQNGLIYCIENKFASAINGLSVNSTTNTIEWFLNLGGPDTALVAYNIGLIDEDLLISGRANYWNDTLYTNLLKINSIGGNTIWERFYSPNFSLSSSMLSAKVIGNRIVGMGKCSTISNENDAFLIVADLNGWAGMEDYIHLQSAVKIYPNPANEILHFTMPYKRFVDFNVYDTFGRVVQSGRTEDMYIDITALHTGIYIIRLIQDGNIWNLTFIKE